ncbi:MAG: hypothetical protein C0482_16095 [Gordonia sp.]|nr:hypothetical protein [Gordonia sp. (in: high G+C Gram-positive bacteria)]
MSKRRLAGRRPDDLDQHFEQTVRDDSSQDWPSSGNPLPLLEALSDEARLHANLHKRLAEWASELTADPTLRDTNYRRVEDALNHACAVERAEAAATALRVVAHHAESLADGLRVAQEYVATLYHDSATDRSGRQTRSA